MNGSPDAGPAHAALMQRLAGIFYHIVPETYRTYCSFTSDIIQSVLRHFGIPCKRVPCQLWYTRPDHIYIIGFLGKEIPGKWDGHVVCCTDDNILVDAATHNFARDFGLAVPWLVMTKMFEFPTAAIAHRALSSTDALWWHPPPQGIDARPPQEPTELVEKFAIQLITELAARASTDGSNH